MPRRGITWAALALGLAACAPDGPRTVSGRAYTTWISEHGPVEVAFDLTGDRLQVLIPDGADGFLRAITPQLGAEGSFEIDGVDPGPYYLIWQPGDGDRPVHVWATEDDARDLDFFRLGRPDLEAPGSLTLRVEGLEPWDPTSHWVTLAAPNLGRWWNVSYDQEPATFETALPEHTRDLGAAVDAAQGDRVYVAQFGDGAVSESLGWASIRRFARIDDLVMTPGDTGTLEVALQEIEPDHTLDVRIDHLDRTLFATQAHRNASPLDVGLRIAAMPRWARTRFHGSAPIVATAASSFATEPFVATIEYGDPYPPDWQRYVVVTSRVRLNQATYLFEYLDAAGRITTLEDFEPDTTVLVTAPQEVRIDGESIWAVSQVHRLAPVLAWEPPVIGTGDLRYQVTVYELDWAGWPTEIAYLSTEATRIVVPAGILEPEKRYQLVVDAWAGTDGDYGWARALSSPFDTIAAP